MAVTRTTDQIALAVVQDEENTRSEEEEMRRLLERGDNPIIRRGPNDPSHPSTSPPSYPPPPSNPPSPTPSNHPSPIPSAPPSPTPSAPPPTDAGLCTVHRCCRDPLLYRMSVCNRLSGLLHTHSGYDLAMLILKMITLFVTFSVIITLAFLYGRTSCILYTTQAMDRIKTNSSPELQLRQDGAPSVPGESSLGVW